MCRRWNIIRFVIMEAQWVKIFTGRAYWILTALEYKARIFGIKNGKNAEVNGNKFLFRNDFTPLWEGKKKFATLATIEFLLMKITNDLYWWIIFLQRLTAASCKIYSASPKGQLISEWLFGVFNFPKKQLKNLMNFCPRI